MIDHNIITVIGLIAGAITSVSFIPQVIKGYQTKKLEDVSYFMYVILIIGLILWLIYGILLEELPIILANGFGIGCCMLVLTMKKTYTVRYQ
jgi:MtN3 and saliva related transmembrane protein